jgi:hypothetical protein
LTSYGIGVLPLMSSSSTGSHSVYVIKVEHEPDSDHRRDRTAHNVSAPSIYDEHQI